MADKVYEFVQSGLGRVQIGDDDRKLEEINKFLSSYPDRARRSPDKNMSTPWLNLSVRELFRRSIQAAVDIINDISSLVSKRNSMSSTEYRRGIFETFTEPSRRVYVGLWLIFIAFVLYFIDSAA